VGPPKTSSKRSSPPPGHLPGKEALERLYRHYNARRWAPPDPVVFLYGYADCREREVVGLVAALLAFGRVAQIHRTIESVLGIMGASPRAFMLEAGERALKRHFGNFCHRFAGPAHMVGLLLGLGRVLRRFGSVEAAFIEGGRGSIDLGLQVLHRQLSPPSGPTHNPLLPDPCKGSACKRWHLFLRWMVRHDEVDPGGWTMLSPSSLMVPVDTHMHRLALRWGLTRRRSPDAVAVQEITHAFRRIRPDDPVRYDFALTRLGIRNDPDAWACLEE